MTDLRHYQQSAITRIRQSIMAGNRRILCVAPTGAGKTIIGAHILNAASQKYKFGIFAAHRREIINQTSEKLEWAGTPHGILMAGKSRSAMSRVHVCSIQTFASRVIRSGHEAPPADVVIIDEAHRSIAKSYTDMVDMYPNAIVIGLTATPVRGDGKGLGNFYDDMIEVASISELMDMGYLVRPHVYAPAMPDLGQVKIKRGDYAEDQLQDAMDKTELVGNIVRDWMLYAKDRPTVVFATGVRHSLHIKEQFERAGITVAHIDGETPKDERDEILQKMEDGEIQVVTNCMVLTEGWDMPKVSCAILARPTKSYGMYLQMAGRILRPYDKKTDAVIIDHAGAVYEHGFVSEAGDWSLDTNETIKERREKKQRKEKSPITCRNCFTVYERQRKCPSCGWEPTIESQELNMKEGRLLKVHEQDMKKQKHTKEDKQYWYAMFKAYARKKGYAEGWVSHKYRGKFGVWPKNMDYVPPKEPDEAFMNYIKHLNIRRAKAKEKAA